MPAGTRPAAPPANAGVQIVEVGQGGLFTADDFVAAIKPAGLPVFPRTTLVEIENTHNRGGGLVFPQAEVLRICAAARAARHGLLPGRRAAVERERRQRPAAKPSWPRPFDLVAVAFSKGLGAPGGSLLAGSQALIDSATGTAGCSAARCARTASTPPPRCTAWHTTAAGWPTTTATRAPLAERAGGSPAVQLDLATVQTNIVVFHLRPGAPDAATLVAQARERGVLLNAFGPRTVRAVTHLDVSAAQVAQAGRTLRELLG